MVGALKIHDTAVSFNLAMTVGLFSVTDGRPISLSEMSALCLLRLKVVITLGVPGRRGVAVIESW